MAYVRAILLGPWAGKRNPGIDQLGAIARMFSCPTLLTNIELTSLEVWSDQ